MIENMAKRTKIILSFIGVAALVVPALLLLLTAAKTRQVPEISQGKRPVDTKSLEETVKKTLPANLVLPSPSPSASPASPSAT